MNYIIMDIMPYHIKGIFIKPVSTPFVPRNSQVQKKSEQRWKNVQIAFILLPVFFAGHAFSVVTKLSAGSMLNC